MFLVNHRSTMRRQLRVVVSSAPLRSHLQFGYVIGDGGHCALKYAEYMRDCARCKT
jgi:hypothetical protein